MPISDVNYTSTQSLFASTARVDGAPSAYQATSVQVMATTNIVIVQQAADVSLPAGLAAVLRGLAGSFGGGAPTASWGVEALPGGLGGLFAQLAQLSQLSPATRSGHGDDGFDDFLLDPERMKGNVFDAIV